MDIKCPVCLEPWDNDTVHEVAQEMEKTYTQVYRDLVGKGCGFAFRGSDYDSSGYCKAVDNEKSELLFALADLMGDDSDGYMAMAEDAEWMGLL